MEAGGFSMAEDGKDGKAPAKIDSKFRYVLVAAQRAEQLMKGARPKFETKGKHTRVAMEEVDREMIEWDYGPAPVPEPVEAAEGEEQPEAAAEEVH
jgi:DNA-directed RNA polymerase omega subunit